MEKEHEQGSSEVVTSRRRVLTSIGWTVATGVCNGFVDKQHQDISSLPDSITQPMDGHSVQSGKQRLAYVTLPGLSMASLLANLPYLMYGSRSAKPVIFIDIHDYNRLQAIALKETDSPWNQSLAMAYGHLFRRGVIQLIDYSNFYMRHTQRKVIKQNQETLKEVPNDVQQRAAIGAAQGRINYQRGEYQETFRENLGEDLDVFIGGRKTEKSRRKRLKRGCGDPLEWNTQILDQYAAALEVRCAADEIFDHLDVKYVIGEGESEIVGKDGLVTTASHIPEQSRIEELPPRDLRHTRKAFETIGQLATEISGVQHNDWVLLSPTLAIPQYDDLFNISMIQNEIESGLNKERLTEEVTNVVDLLERQPSDDPEMTYAAEYLAESDIMPFASSPTQRQAITKIGNYATTLTRFSNELRPMVRDGDISHVAGLIGATLVSDPSPHDDLDKIYQQGVELINRLDPPSINETQLTAIRRRKQGWDETLDWYEKTNRTR